MTQGKVERLKKNGKSKKKWRAYNAMNQEERQETNSDVLVLVPCKLIWHVCFSLSLFLFLFLKYSLLYTMEEGCAQDDKIGRLLGSRSIPRPVCPKVGKEELYKPKPASCSSESGSKLPSEQ